MRKVGETDLSVTCLPSAKRGRPLLLGDELDSQVQTYIKALRDEGGVITTLVTMVIALAIVETSSFRNIMVVQ